MDKILLNGMCFYAYHGAFPEENRLGQRFYVDLEMRLDLKAAGESDDLSKTVNYADVYELVKKETTETQVKLIETLAERIAASLLSVFPIAEVRVRVTKPDPPIPGYYQSVGVEIVRRRA
ncbi:MULTISPECIES: dihydroneopterin aldolase [Thermoactinomyces]|uniref:7,8-dihydroneopterin aldolase n=1 Tax=Thermoactinomyces daqus TaxID=1329516 RepID=A0A7W1X9G7_9BACL|nr:dihydroneopterin aldolase [Thermoactinomyces daqus]MBA4542423.1 dihydroneopterin aldolase [Thermoactinomyces daqus]MBH8607401.1 dihydroneopterin aldolase [Thermoactinomyces sp. CICC 10521]